MLDVSSTLYSLKNTRQTGSRNSSGSSKTAFRTTISVRDSWRDLYKECIVKGGFLPTMELRGFHPKSDVRSVQTSEDLVALVDGHGQLLLYDISSVASNSPNPETLNPVRNQRFSLAFETRDLFNCVQFVDFSGEVVPRLYRSVCV